MNLSNIAGLGAPIPPADGPAAMVGQRPHMDYAGLPKQSMHELAVWSAAGGNGAPQPVKLTVNGADDLLHWGEPFSLKRKYGYFAPNADNTAMINAPMSIDVSYDDGSTKDLQPADLAYTIAAPDGSTEDLTLGQELQQACGGRRQLTISYTEDDATVSTQLAVMIGEPVTDDMKLRFKIGVEIPEAARNDVIPELEANRHVSNASAYYLNNDLLFNVDADTLSIEPVASCFDATTGRLMSGWLFKTGGDGRPTGVSNESIYLLINQKETSGDPTSPSYYITEVLSDPDRAWAVTDGDFRNGQFSFWTSLQYGLVEEPGTTAYGIGYRESQYAYCSHLQGFKNADGEVVERPEEASGVTLLGETVSGYRAEQFIDCSSLVTPLVEHSPIIKVTVADVYSFRRYQYSSCRSLLTAADEDPLPAAEHAFSLYDFRGYQYSNCTALTRSAVEHTYDLSGTVDTAQATKSGFRDSQYARCTALKPNGVEKMLERLTGTSGSGLTRYNKYALTGVTDATPFYYQDDGTGEPTPALQRDLYEPADGSYVHQYMMYGGHSDTAYKISAETRSEWKTTYQAGETLDLTGLIVWSYRNDGRIDSFDSFPSVYWTFTPAAGSVLDAGTDSVTIRYKAYDNDVPVSTTVPITVVAPPSPPTTPEA